MAFLDHAALFRIVPAVAGDPADEETLNKTLELVAILENAICRQIGVFTAKGFWEHKEAYVDGHLTPQLKNVGVVEWNFWRTVYKPPPEIKIKQRKEKPVDIDLDKIIDEIVERLISELTEKLLVGAAVVAAGLIIAALVRKFGEEPITGIIEEVAMGAEQNQAIIDLLVDVKSAMTEMVNYMKYSYEQTRLDQENSTTKLLETIRLEFARMRNG